MRDLGYIRCWCEEKKEICKVMSIDYSSSVVSIYSQAGAWSATFPFNQVEFMQATGLSDTKGNDIYDGDIVEIDHDRGESFRHLIEYNDRFGGYYVEMSSTECDYESLHENFADGRMYFEVIGNKYENPELLEQCE